MLQSIEQSIWWNAQNFSDKIALKSGKNAITYMELVTKICAAKQFLKVQTFYQPESAIVIAASKQLGFVYAYFGAHLAGLQVVPIDAETNTTRFQHIIDTVRPICVIGFNRSEDMSVDCPFISLKDFDNMEKLAYEDTPEFPALEKIADILFTTGTTGTPKGVPLTFRNEAAAARNINEYIGNSKDDIELLALPLSHSFGLGRMRCCLMNGQTLILQGSFANVKRLFRIIEEEHVTGFTMVPASWKYLQKMSGNKLSEFASQLKYIEMGSAYFSAEDKRELAELFPTTRVTMHYGLTEASRSAFMEFHADSKQLMTLGKPSPYTEILILDEEGNVLPDGEEGEICIKGEHVTSGYINIPNDEIYWDDYFRTGDWGIRDAEGYISLKSRKKELINVGGKKVSPNEVEEQLLKMEGIDDCACVPMIDPNGVMGEVVKAYIVSDKELDFEKVNQLLATLLEGYKIPAAYVYIDSIPRTNNGKIQRNLLI